MSTRTSPLPDHLVLYGQPWSTYIRLLRLFPDRRLRITYDRGALEIMTLTHEHESDNRFLALLVVVLTEELHMPIRQGGSNTMKRRRLQRGLEPDSCFWIANEAKVRQVTRLNWRINPPPDLALEVDVTRRSVKRMPIYRAFKVPELWRLRGPSLTFNLLAPDGRYAPTTSSKAFPGLKPADIEQFLVLRGTMDDNAVVRQFRIWIRQHLSPAGSLPPTP